MIRLPVAALLATLLCLPAAAAARTAWTLDGIPLTRAAEAQSHPALVSDGGAPAEGGSGAIALWRDERFGPYGAGMMRVLAAGALSATWPANGLYVTGDSGPCGEASLVADGTGGAWTAWWGTFATPYCGVLVSHVVADGTVLHMQTYPFDSVGVPTPPQLALASDGDLFVAWNHADTAGTVSIRVQRLGPDGEPAAGWPWHGVPLDPGARSRFLATLVADDAGGAYVLTTQAHGDSVHLLLHHVTATGTTAAGFPDTGLVVRRDVGQSPHYAMVSDAASPSGVLVAWWADDPYLLNRSAVYAQRITAAGAVAAGWPAAGLRLCQSPLVQVNPEMVPDGAGGAVVAWLDLRDAEVTGTDVYAQRVTAAGAIAAGWPADGLAVCAATGSRAQQVLAPDGAGGAFVAWTDWRAAGSTAPDIYVQRVTGAGAIAAGWPADGVAACGEAAAQSEPAIVAGASGAIIAWTDSRNLLDSGEDVYVTAIDGNGALSASQTALFAMEPPYPNPAAHGATFVFGLTRASDVEVALYDVAGRLVRRLVPRESWAAGQVTRAWDGLDDAGREVRPGLYFVTAKGGGLEVKRKIAVVR